MNDERYSLLQRLLHWLMAVMVLGLLGAGLFLWYYGFEGATQMLGEENRNLLYKYHKTFGIVVLGLMVLRVLLRLTLGAPSHYGQLNAFEKNLSGAVQAYLYAALIAMPVLGWLATDISGYPVEFFDMVIPHQFEKNPALGEELYRWHAYVGFTICGLLALHVLGALRHWIIKRDHVMGRMGFF